MRFWVRIWTAALVVCGSAAMVFTPHAQVAQWTDAAKTAMSRALGTGHSSPYSKQHPLRVMAVGGSSAEGYDDPDLDGYLARALSSVSSTLHIPMTFINKAQSGQIPTMLAPTYDPLLHSVRPDVVIISWGLLNGISRKVPTTMFQRVIQEEVSMAVKYGADVWIVTPPVTPATYVGHDVKLLPKYAALEIAGARAVHSSHVHVFDLMNDMKKYLQVHHQPYQPLESNNWHMNRAGHELAGKILANAILQRAQSIGLTS